MRLLLRANSHRRTDEGSIEIAASPDTPHRELWQWHIRLNAAEAGSPPGQQGVQLSCGDGRQLRLQTTTRAETVWAETVVHQVEQPLVIRRPATDVLVLLVHQGEALVEQRHQLAELDVMVLEGDDPLEVIVEPLTVPTGVAEIRLRSVSDRPLAWVP